MEGPSPSPLPFSSYAVSFTEAQNATGGFVLQVNLERPLNTSWVSKYHSKGFALLVSCKTCWETMDGKGAKEELFTWAHDGPPGSIPRLGHTGLHPSPLWGSSSQRLVSV